MYIFEIFKKRRKFEPIFTCTWERVSKNMVYPSVADEDPAQKLVYYGLMAYAVVFEAALAADMSTSAAHHLARLQVGKYKFDPLITRAVERVFADAETEAERGYADLFLSRVAQLITRLDGKDSDAGPVLKELSQAYKTVTF